jgi:hypothetical protein
MRLGIQSGSLQMAIGFQSARDIKRLGFQSQRVYLRRSDSNLLVICSS